MEMVAAQAPSPLVSVAELKAYLRIETSEEDALLAGLLRSAAGLCEAFTGRALIARAVEEVARESAAWTRLGLTPVRSISGVERLSPDGNAIALAAADYAIDIDSNGDGWVRSIAGSGQEGRSPKRVRVSYVAGMAADWNGVPEALRQGVVRLAAHLYTERDGADAQPPAAVTALWRPYRRMRLA